MSCSATLQTDSICSLQMPDNMTEKSVGKHRRDCISNLLEYSSAAESMTQRKCLKTSGFSVRIATSSAWMIIFSAVTGDSLSERSRVVRAFWGGEEAPIRVMIWSIRRNVADGVVDCSVREEVGIRRTVSRRRERWKNFSWTTRIHVSFSGLVRCRDTT
jgi:hypothetical protein